MRRHRLNPEVSESPLPDSTDGLQEDADADPALGHNRLAAIATEIVEAHRSYKRTRELAAAWIIKQGELLVEAKGILGHGRFGNFVRRHCPFAERTAQMYMMIYQRGWKPAMVADMGVRAASDNLEAHLRFGKSAEHARNKYKARPRKRPDPEARQEHYRRRKIRGQFRVSDAVDDKTAPFEISRSGHKLLVLEKPAWGQVLWMEVRYAAAAWSPDIPIRVTHYVWRPNPPLAKEDSGRDYRRISHEIRKDEGGRDVCSIDYSIKAQFWDEFAGIPYQKDDEVDYEIWDADMTFVGFLTEHWRMLKASQQVFRRERRASDDPDRTDADEVQEDELPLDEVEPDELPID